MAKESERTRVMRENFMTYHEQGYTIKEIAEKSGLSDFTVYHNLQRIADEHGVSRDSLLKVVKGPRSERAFQEERQRVTVNVEELRAGFQEAGNLIDFLIETIDETLKEEKGNDSITQ